MSIHQTLFATYDNPMIVCDSADFDGTNDYMTRGAGLTGAADSKLGIASLWHRIDGGDGAIRSLLSAATTLAGADFRFELSISAANKFQVAGRNSAGTLILNLLSSAHTAGASWLHILMSWDMGNAASHLYVNDVSDKTSSTFTDDTIDYTWADCAVGARPDGSVKLDGCLAELYLAPGQYLDFSNVYNRRKFISASGKPVHLGTTGALPTGTAPLVYQHLDDAEAVADFATNRGTGGDFTITGTLATGSDSPSD